MARRSPIEIGISEENHGKPSRPYPVDSEPFRTLSPKTETSTERLRCLGSFVDLTYNGFEHTEDTVQLARTMSHISVSSETATYSFLLHVDNQCPSVELANTEEMNIFVATQFLWCL